MIDLSGCTLLLVDDEEANLDLLEGFLETEGYRSLVRTCDARTVVGLLEEHDADLVLLDLHMPHHSGFEVLRRIRERTPDGEWLPVLVLTADVTPEAKERALREGARDFLTKPFDGVEVLLRVRNLLEARVLHRAQRTAREAAEAAEGRAALLAEASRVLSASLDAATGLAQLAHLVVPRLADACAVELREDDGWRRAAEAHAGPGAAALLAAGAEEGDDGALSIPLRTGGAAFGRIRLARAAGGFAAEERELAAEMARRAALAVENARLFAESRRAAEARDHMLSVVAHDLRNPLAVIGMCAEMAGEMLPPRATPDVRENLDRIRQSARHMYRLVEDLLEVSRVDAGGVPLRLEEVLPATLFGEALLTLRPLAAARGIRLEAQGEMDLPRVRADAARVLQVLSNLIGNAVKFTPDRGVVTLSARPAGEELRVSVADTGPGIAADHLPHVFGAFWQAQSADRRGVGLGLAIARSVVESHGGRIWVESREGEGTVFHFTLPLAAASAAVEEAPLAEPAPA